MILCFSQCFKLRMLFEHMFGKVLSREPVQSQAGGCSTSANANVTSPCSPVPFSIIKTEAPLGSVLCDPKKCIHTYINVYVYIYVYIYEDKLFIVISEGQTGDSRMQNTERYNGNHCVDSCELPTKSSLILPKRKCKNLLLSFSRKSG